MGGRRFPNSLREKRQILEILELSHERRDGGELAPVEVEDAERFEPSRRRRRERLLHRQLTGAGVLVQHELAFFFFSLFPRDKRHTARECRRVAADVKKRQRTRYERGEEGGF